MSKTLKQVMDYVNTAYLKTFVNEEPKYNPLDLLKTEDNEEFEKKLTWLLMQPDYFWFLVKNILNVDLLPFQTVILGEIWQRKFPMLIATRGGGKTFLLALYGLIRALLLRNRKILVAGAAFRQSKFVFEYMDTIWKNAPILRDICDQDSGMFKATDKCYAVINGSTVTCIPIGTGDKIRGYRAGDLIAEEFASHNEEIFETVLSGFGNVSSNPTEAVKLMAALIQAEEDGVDLSLLNSDPTKMKNQILLSGTAFYSFNHFSKYWNLYKKIIETRGDKKRLEEIFPDGVQEGFNWKDYSIIRLPYELLPKGFMDEGNVARSKAAVHSSIFNMEFGAVFANDSTGFFKRTLIESCVASELNNVNLPSGKICFDAMIRGNPNKKYVIGVDPASEIDNFSIVITEVNEDHRRIVYCWTTNRKSHIERLKLGLTQEDNFYGYCVRKIRDLMKAFNVIRIMLDSQGGGIAVNEGLHSAATTLPGEVPLWPIIEEGREKPTDGEAGLHIVELVNFAKADWVSEANHGMRKDFEDKTLLFPKFDPVVLALSAEQDFNSNRLYDTLEDCVMEIEELKNELTLIEVTKTQNGRDRWDTPEVKTSGNKKSKMRKDRYSSLLMSNMGARQISNVKESSYSSYGGFSNRLQSDKGKPNMIYTGPSWFTDAIKGVYD